MTESATDSPVFLASGTERWMASGFGFTKAQKDEKPAFREWLGQSQNPLGRYLAGGNWDTSDSRFRRPDVTALENEIERRSPKGVNQQMRLTMLSKVIWHVNHRFQRSIPPSKRAALRAELANPIVNGEPRAEETVYALLTAERRWIESLEYRAAAFKSGARANVPASLVVFSAVLHGGLLNADAATALVEALANRVEHFAVSSTRVYADLYLPWRRQPNQEFRRWYPDPITACLIGRVSLESIAQIRKANAVPVRLVKGARTAGMARALWAEMAGGLKPFLDQPHRPRSLNHLFRIVETALLSQSPSILAEFCARKKVVARSLLPASIGRVYGEPVIRAIETKFNTERFLRGGEDVEAEVAESPDERRLPDPYEWMARLRIVLAATERKEVARAVAASITKGANATPYESLIYKFSAYLYDHGSSYGSSLKPPSIRTCVLAVCRRYLPLFRGLDPTTTAADLRATYCLEALQEAAEKSKSPQRMLQNTGWALREFERHLVAEHKTAGFDEREIFRFPQGLLPVSARIITLDDCHKVLTHIDRQPDSSPGRRVSRAAKVMAVLGFFGGLRRMEALGLRLIDFPGGLLMPVLVRNWDGRQLKTPNAVRLIVLRFFASKPFLDIAQHWIENLEPNTARESPLFSGISDDVVIPVIHQALRAVTS